MQTIKINNCTIGPGSPCFIIAEAGVNHNGDLQKAIQLVDIAVKAGVDAVKFQTFKAERVVSPQTPKAAYQIESTGSRESQFEMVRRLELSFDDFEALNAFCETKGILFLSSPFDEESADFLVRLGVTAFKLGSGEITNIPLISHIALMGKPMIVSTGMSTMSEVGQAVDTICSNGNPPLVLLHCVSSYPTNIRDSNLRAMLSMASEFSVPTGWSDHTLGTLAVLAAVSLGASVIEKHFTLDNNLPGPDHQVSLEPDELAKMVREIRLLEKSFGDGIKKPTMEEIKMAQIVRKSLHLKHDLEKGHILTKNDFVSMRPGNGFSPSLLTGICGNVLKTNLPKGTLLLGDHLE